MFINLKRIIAILVLGFIIINSSFAHIVYAEDFEYVDIFEDADLKYINAREMNIIIARILGVNDKMVKDDSILDVPCYIPQNFVNTFSDYELGYYKLLYVVFDKYSKLREANPIVMGYREYSPNSVSVYDFMNAYLRTRGVFGNDKYMILKAQEINLIPRNLKKGYLGSLVERKSAQKLVDNMLDTKAMYYYDEDTFLKGNLSPIENKENITYRQLLSKNYGLNNKEDIYKFIFSNLSDSDSVKRIQMIKYLDWAIGYTPEKFQELYDEKLITLPYAYEGTDIVVNYYLKLAAYAKYYFDIKSYESWDMELDNCEYIKWGNSTKEIKYKEKDGTRSYTIRGEEFVSGEEVVNYMLYYLNNNSYENENVVNASKKMSLTDKISKNDFNVLLDAFQLDLNDKK